MRKNRHFCHFYQTQAGNGRFPTPVPSKQKTTWMRFLLFCLYGREEGTAVAQLKPIPVRSHRNPYPRHHNG